ncbi:hypothetical protein ACFLRX_00680 [Acidobacteriota bacterium]
MKQNKYSVYFTLCLLSFLFFQQETTAESTYQTQDEFQMRNNEYSSQIFSIKLFGSLDSLVGQNDVNNHLDGWNQLLNDNANIPGFSTNGEISPLGKSTSFGGELIFNFLPHFSIGLGAGYLQFTEPSTKTLSISGENIDFSLDSRISAIPITLNLYYGIPIGNFLNIVVGAGAGYYLGQFSNFIQQNLGDEQISSLFESNKNTIGAQVSLNFELNIVRTMALFFGVSGRFATLKDLEGEETFTYINPTEEDSVSYPDRTLWYVEEEIDGKYYTALFADNDKPEGDWYRNSRKAEVSLSSIVMQFGIRIMFGQKSR